VVQTVVLVSVVAAAAALLLRFGLRRPGDPLARRPRPTAVRPGAEQPVPIQTAPKAPGAPTAPSAPEAVGAPVAAGAPTAPDPVPDPVPALPRSAKQNNSSARHSPTPARAHRSRLLT
jgi:hypothetical protein